MTGFKQSDRTAEMIRRKLSELIQREVKDPRLPKFVSISSVQISSDLSYARVYFIVAHEEAPEATRILNNAASFLRKALSQCVTYRTVPKLVFEYDDSMEYGRKMSKLIDEANKRTSAEDDDSGEE